MEENGNYKVTVEHRLTRMEVSVAGLEADVKSIMTNHLPHIQAAIDDVKSKMVYGLWFLVVTLAGVIVDIALRLYPYLHA